MRVLVVDDSKATRSFFGDILEDLGFEVLVAENGVEALKHLRETPNVAVVLVDWVMPEMDGLDFVKAVRSDPVFDEVRLMMVTSENETAKVQTAIDAGADEYLMKPVTEEMIREKLTLIGFPVEE